MKVLFICYANVGRSPVAEGCFRRCRGMNAPEPGSRWMRGSGKSNSRKLKYNTTQHSVDRPSLDRTFPDL